VVATLGLARASLAPLAVVSGSRVQAATPKNSLT
jgi:hypothetical protein